MLDTSVFEKIYAYRRISEWLYNGFKNTVHTGKVLIGMYRKK